jgi:hypothetical protein
MGSCGWGSNYGDSGAISLGPPTTSTFLTFIRSVMEIPVDYLPDNDPTIVTAFSVAYSMVNVYIRADVTLYTLAVHNLAADLLINFAVDQQGRTFFRDLRKALKLHQFIPGALGSVGDQGTFNNYATPEAMRQFTLSDLQRLKTPYGQRYLQIAQSVGSLWGLS